MTIVRLHAFVGEKTVRLLRLSRLSRNSVSFVYALIRSHSFSSLYRPRFSLLDVKHVDIANNLLRSSIKPKRNEGSVKNV